MYYSNILTSFFVDFELNKIKIKKNKINFRIFIYSYNKIIKIYNMNYLYIIF